MTQAAMIECVDFTIGWVPALAGFLQAIDDAGEAGLFAPHARDETTLRQLATQHRRDVYCLLVEDRHVLGYGLLRGWDQGYDIPSLGIAIHPQARSSGLGRLLMEYLELMAARRGASHVRLRVLRTNAKAIRMYGARGYNWSDDPDRRELMVGMKPLQLDRT
jgi:[ribosomal protein S18]-alanine N-acetyltransferase